MTDRDDILERKSRLRAEAIARRDAIAEDVRRDRSTRLAGIDLSPLMLPPQAAVSAYMAMGAEIDPAPLVARLNREGHPICLPVVQPRGQPLVFRQWAPGDPLVPRIWGIKEPVDSAPVVEPDVLVVPLLAYDRHGYRLGYGGGFYDRTLAKLRARKTIIAIGLGFHEQEVAEVPHADYDERVDWILTPERLIRSVSS